MFSAFVLLALVPSVQQHWAQVTLRQRVIIRVPRNAAGPATVAKVAPLRGQPPPPIRWTEKKAPQCLPMGSLAGIAITRSDSVDLMLTGGRRIRAKLDKDCPALDFYSGFYLQTPRDAQMCAKRDSIRSRAGGECQIKAFRTLVPKR